MQSITLTRKVRVFVLFCAAVFVLYTPLVPRPQIIETEEQLRNLLYGFPIPFVRYPFVTGTGYPGLESGPPLDPDPIYLWGVRVSDYGAPLDPDSMRKRVQHLPRDYAAEMRNHRGSGNISLEFLLLTPFGVLYQAIMWLYLLNVVLGYSLVRLVTIGWNRFIAPRKHLVYAADLIGISGLVYGVILYPVVTVALVGSAAGIYTFVDILDVLRKRIGYARTIVVAVMYLMLGMVVIGAIVLNILPEGIIYALYAVGPLYLLRKSFLNRSGT